jgi:hypothetical protein
MGMVLQQLLFGEAESRMRGGTLLSGYRGNLDCPKEQPQQDDPLIFERLVAQG